MRGVTGRARRGPFIHRHSQSTNHAQQAFGNQGRLHGGGDLEGEPGKLHRGPAGGGQSRGFLDYSQNTAFWNTGDSVQATVPSGCSPAGDEGS